MKKFYFGMTIDDIALADWSTVEHFSRLIEFLTDEKIPATCFVVPVDEQTDQPETDEALCNEHQHDQRHGQQQLRTRIQMIKEGITGKELPDGHIVQHFSSPSFLSSLAEGEGSSVFFSFLYESSADSLPTASRLIFFFSSASSEILNAVPP